MFLRDLYYLKKLMKTQWWDREKIEKYQLHKLRKILLHANKNSDYYHHVFKKHRINPSSIRSLEDLERVPTLKKEDKIKNFSNGIISNNFNKKSLVYKTTSGSTGTPSTVAYNQKCLDIYMGFYGRMLLNSGVKLNDRISFFWYEMLKKKAYGMSLGVFNKKTILYTEHEKKQYEMLIRQKPNIICGFPTILNSMANIAIESKQKVIRPKVIISLGESLDSNTRKKVEETFNTKIFNFYASAEFVCIGAECRQHDGIHINSEGLIAETIKKNNVNKILITDLNNYAMPLIRYEIGDIGEISGGRCECGRGLTLIKDFKGKSDDYIKTQHGRLISPRIIGGAFEHIPNISKFKITQKSLDSIHVHLECDYDEILEKNIILTLDRIFEENINIKVSFNKNIETKNRKFKLIESNIKNEKN